MFLPFAATSRINAIMPQPCKDNTKAPAIASAFKNFMFFFQYNVFFSSVTTKYMVQSSSVLYTGSTIELTPAMPPSLFPLASDLYSTSSGFFVLL